MSNQIITRREFIYSVAALTGGAALAACSQRTPEPTPIEVNLLPINEKRSLNLINCDSPIPPEYDILNALMKAPFGENTSVWNNDKHILAVPPNRNIAIWKLPDKTLAGVMPINVNSGHFPVLEDDGKVYLGIDDKLILFDKSSGKLYVERNFTGQLTPEELDKVVIEISPLDTDYINKSSRADRTSISALYLDTNRLKVSAEDYFDYSTTSKVPGDWQRPYGSSAGNTRVRDVTYCFDTSEK